MGGVESGGGERQRLDGSGAASSYPGWKRPTRSGLLWARLVAPPGGSHTRRENEFSRELDMP